MSDDATTTEKADPKAEEKERLAKDLVETHAEIERLKKKKEYLKDKLDPLLAEGEKFCGVEKVVRRNLDIDDKLLAELEERFGPSIVKKSVNTSTLRVHMKEDAELDKLIPRKKGVSLRVG